MTAASPARYNTIAIALHWLIALLMIPMLFFGEELMEGAEDGGGTFLPSLHVTLGVSILVLSISRLAWRVINPPPAFAETGPAWEQMAAKATHVLFYVLMILLPLSGFLAFPEFAKEELGGGTLSLFGFLPMPTAPELGLPANDAHELGSKVGIALVLLHVAAALKHQFFNRDGLMKRMSPH